MWKKFMAAVISLGIFAGVANAADLKIPEITTGPKLDGTLDDPVWKQATRVETLYGLAGQSSKDTQLWLARDKKWLYLGARCDNPNMAHVAQQAYEHDGPVSSDDALEVFIRPSAASGKYAHFLLNFANVAKEQRCDKANSSMRDIGWNPPWRTAAKRDAKGWTAEIAIPLYCLETDDLGSMSLNVCRAFMAIELDVMGAKRSEKAIGYALLPGGKFHDFAGFLSIGGMGGFKPEVPFAPQVRSATIAGLRQTDGKTVYNLKLELETAKPGKTRIAVMEDSGNGEVEALSRDIELDGMSEIVLSVPIADFGERAVRVVLSDPVNGAPLVSTPVPDVSALNAIKKAFVGRSYYTAEETAEVRLELGLPEATLGRATLTMDVNGEKILALNNLRSTMTPSLPTRVLRTGENQVTARVTLDGKELAKRTLTMTKLEPRPGREVQADYIKGVLLKNKEPFFPVGIDAHALQYRVDSSGRGNDEEEVFRHLGETIGLNVLMRHDKAKNIPAFMKLAEKYGLNVITWSSAQPLSIGSVPGVWPPPPCSLSLPERLKIQREKYEKLEPGLIAETKTLREYENFLAYYNVDEPNLVNPDERIAAAEWYYKTVEKLDPYRPQFLLYARYIPTGDNWTRWGQLLGYDVYPAPPYFGDDFSTEPGLSTAYYAWELRERCRQDNKLMFFIPLANYLDPWRTPIGLSSAHMRCQAYAAIVYGAKGFIYFTLPSVIGQDAWDGLREIAAQVKEMAPALTNGEIAREIKYVPDNFRPRERKFPMINAEIFRYPNGDYLLVAVNIVPYAVNAKFRVDGARSGVRLFDNKSSGGWLDWFLGSANDLSIDDETFTDKIGPYGTRAYRLKLDGAPVPTRVTVDMTPIPEETAPTVDLLSVIRRTARGKNHMPNPCFERQTNPGVPDFYKPYFCLGVDIAAGQKGSDWYLDDQARWNGRPSLRTFLRGDDQEKCRGFFASFYPPPSEKPLKMTFSFYARSEDPKATLWVRIDDDKPVTIPLKTTWTRHHLAFTLPAKPPTCWGARPMLIIPSRDAAVWLNGLQMETGDQPTEFVDSAVIVKEKAPEDPNNLLKNGDAEYGDVTFWTGLEDFRKGASGLREGAGRRGDYAFEWRGQSTQIVSDLIAVDTEKTYALRGAFKAEGAAKPSVTFGVTMADAEKRNIMAWNHFSVSGTRTTLVAPCAAGSNVLKVKGASTWKTGDRYAAAFGKEENALNFDVSPLGVTDVRPEGDHWKITLKQPCGMTFPAGTPVTENQAASGGIFFPDAINAAIPGDWREFKGTIGPKQWWPGTKYVKVVILPRQNGPGALLIDDLFFGPEKP